MLRIFLFLLTNISVIIIFSLILGFTGIKSNSIHGILIMSLLFGFLGSFISLFMSKWIALKSVDGEIIEKPSNDIEDWLIRTIIYQANKVNIKIPQIAIYDSPDINAFATGACRNSSLIAVSSGLLKNMNKEESEAVIAHEISHISNGDMVTMTLIQGVVNTFVIFFSRFITLILTNLLYNSNNESKDENENNSEEWINRNNSLFNTIITTILELIFGILASIITMWFSRYREFQADAGSAKLVGIDKMIAALQCLKNSYEPQGAAEIMSFCINGKSSSKSLKYLFMTHPPIEERIEALRIRKYIK